MLAQQLIRLLEDHADAATREGIEQLVTNPRTASFRGVPRAEVTARLGALYRSLASWLGVRNDDAVRAAYEDWGRTRFTQAVPISEIVYAVILAKDHLRRFAHDHGVTELHELDALIGEFFDRALYYLVRGYEMQAATPPGAARVDRA